MARFEVATSQCLVAGRGFDCCRQTPCGRSFVAETAMVVHLQQQLLLLLLRLLLLLPLLLLLLLQLLLLTYYYYYNYKYTYCYTEMHTHTIRGVWLGGET